ncbi:zinc transporter 6 [Sinocyclocheilus anshuiensis]|uniref:Cation efflux protein transmembrane domain-containing protein n=1 Tax=Sinocyclocheilus anshuiensis TaxID=1608454 RepID=A0A671PRT0_9TELE|nr:PREDICTED: zinc transporter 6 [Sinocyclocheilus anshuiensis]
MALDGSSTSVMAHENPYHIHVSDYYSRSLSNKPDVVPSGVTERKVSPSDKPDMVALDVISIKESDAPVHRKKREADTCVLGTIHPFRKTHRSVLGRFAQEFSLVTSDRRSWRILLFAVLNLICTACLLMWCSSTNSMALTAYTYLTIFDLFSLITCLLSFWVTMKKPSQVYSFGFERLEVLAVFASTVLVQLGALFILKESVERFVEQPEVHTGRLLVGTFVALFFNLLTLLSVKNKPFVFVSEAASTSWLQEHVADLSRSLCGLIPALSSVLLPRMNPFVLINLAGACALGITYMLIEINNYNAMDTASAMAIALMIFGTMYPMSVYSGKVLLQTTPSHVIGQLDKLLREVSTLDGVLEVRNEHFWTIGFGSLAGSVHVRIRRDADEQMVLAHVTNRLNTLVSTLTVQIFKDDWARHSLTSSTLPTGSLSLSEYVTSAGFPPVMSKQHDELNPATSTPAKLSSPPPEFSFNTPGKHIQPVVFQTAHQHRPFNAPLSYGMPPYSSMLNQGFAHPSDGPAMRLGFGVGARMPSVQGYRTVNAAPHRYGSSLPSSQTGQQRP